MNIFYLDRDPVKAAQQMCDRHVVKMILESAQMLCTAHHELTGSDSLFLYKSTHKNHPSSIWVRQSKANYMWLYNHMMALNEEYKFRYSKTEDHKSVQKLGVFLKTPPKNISGKPFCVPPACMDDQYKISSCVIKNYRNYYINAKSSFATWKNRIPPKWYNLKKAI